LSESDFRLLKLFRQTVLQRWPGSGETAVAELVTWPLDHALHCILLTSILQPRHTSSLKSFLSSLKSIQVHHWGLTSIHTCRSYVHTPHDIPQTVHL